MLVEGVEAGVGRGGGAGLEGKMKALGRGLGHERVEMGLYYRVAIQKENVFGPSPNTVYFQLGGCFHFWNLFHNILVGGLILLEMTCHYLQAAMAPSHCTPHCT